MYSDPQPMRLFFGAELTEDARRAAAGFALSACDFWPGRYVPAGNYHMTLCFVGMVRPEQLKEVRLAGKLAAARWPAAPLTLGEPGFFGKREKAILYLNALGARAYDPLALVLRHLLEEAGLPWDPKPFAPHITLARNVRMDAREIKGPRPVTWTPQGLCLFHSHRIRGELTYTPIARWGGKP